MASGLRVRRVRLRVANVVELAEYHGREAALIGEAVDAVELETTGSRSLGQPVVAYVDDRDGEAAELAEAVVRARAAGVVGSRYERELEEHAKRRFLHGEVIGVRT